MFGSHNLPLKIIPGEILECFFDGKKIREEYVIVRGGGLAGMGAHSYSAGTATDGSEEAANFKD